MKPWIDFRKIREELPFAAVLQSYGIQNLQNAEGGQYRGPCPLPNHVSKKENSFSAHLEKKVWRCFECDESGNILDFAVMMAGLDKKNGNDVRKVALDLQKRFLETAEPKVAATHPKEELPFIDATGGIIVNQPLDFALKTLEDKHPFFDANKISPDTVSRFGLGYCKRGTLSGRIAIPLHDDGGQLVGYAGLVVNDARVTESNPKYAFPTEREVHGAIHVFDRSKFLYNGFRIGMAVKDLIVVQDCHSVWSLWQSGFANVVCLMGDECSDEHAAYVAISTIDAARIWFLSDHSERAMRCAQSFLTKVARNRLCRWVELKNGEEMAPDHPLLALLPKR